MKNAMEDSDNEVLDICDLSTRKMRGKVFYVFTSAIKH